MKIFILMLVGFTQIVLADYTFSISKIKPDIEQRMLRGNSWKKNCPVQLEDLRYLKMAQFALNVEKVL